jgi:16S rRNA (uracil1498-N3)-methyltransferase
MDWLVEKATELGVERIVPLQENGREGTGGTIKQAGALAQDLYRSVATCGRSSIPEVLEPIPLRGIAQYIDGFKHRWMLYEKERKRHLRDVLGPKVSGEICVAVGPEGDLKMRKLPGFGAGVPPVDAGENILRTETTRSLFSQSFL